MHRRAADRDKSGIFGLVIEISGGFRRIANATEKLKPVGAVLRDPTVVELANYAYHSALRWKIGLAMLIAESEDGQCEPVAVVANVGEAREVAARHAASRGFATRRAFLSAARLPSARPE